MAPRAIAAPRERFLDGLRKAQGYNVEESPDRVRIAFEPEFVEAPEHRGVPCLRLVFRKVGDEVVLETFTVCDGTEERPVDLRGAHDALQAWMDSVTD